MKLSIGIVGLPNVGKSTLFKVLTKQEVNIANYPFATIDPNVGVVVVPDDRLEKLTKLSKSKKTIPAVVEFYDIAGLVKGANKGEGLGNQFLSHIKETQAIVLVLRIFENPEIIHVENSVDPLRDMEIIHTELILKDLEAVDKRLSKAEAEARTGDKKAMQDRDALQLIKKCLDAGDPPSGNQELFGLARTNKTIKDLNLLTAKREICLLNGEEKDVSNKLKDKIRKLGGDYVVADLGKEDPEAVATLIKKAYEVLGLVSFFTTGEDETRAWTIERGTKAPEAAGVIHTDFETKFIRAEVINSAKLLECGGPSAGSGANAWNQAKQKGQIRLEGKEYVMQDGDVVVVRHG
ncbi:MAG: redox-regulated ATPase YchF [Candidatus Liptonbacteria bacterium]|nr:redox-regulated ATPase YchF [Candidatus Liptonbacteria bacterium]